MLKEKTLLRWGLILIFLFFIFTVFIHFGRFLTTDFKITQFLQTIFPRIVDTPFSLFSLIGSLELATLFLFILWAICKRLNFFFVLVFFAVMHVIELVGKAYVIHPQPPVSFFRYDLGVLFPSSYVQPGSSYPSGHASRTAFLSILILVMIWNSKISKEKKYLIIGLVIIFDLIMFVSRVYLGEHWASDVIGGILVGVSFGLFSSAILYSSKRSSKQ